MRRALTIAAVLVAALGGPAVAAAPKAPTSGVIVEGKTFAGLPLGLTATQVRAHWGRRYGVCDDCGAGTTTWYYTFRRYEPRGIGVEFRHGHVDAYFTVGSPDNWRTARGIAIGAYPVDVQRIYGSAPTVVCTGYSALEVTVRGELLLMYLDADRVYGLGLAATSANPCR
jgi:hypothetical protein